MFKTLAMVCFKLSKLIARRKEALRPARRYHGRAGDVISERLKEDRTAERLAALPPMVREVFLLRVLERMPMDQIAHQLAISREEAARNLRRAVRALLP